MFLVHQSGDMVFNLNKPSKHHASNGFLKVPICPYFREDIDKTQINQTDNYF